MTRDAWQENYWSLWYAEDMEEADNNVIPEATGEFQKESEVLKQMQHTDSKRAMEQAVDRSQWLLGQIQAAFNLSYTNDVEKEHKTDFTLDETLIPFLGFVNFR